MKKIYEFGLLMVGMLWGFGFVATKLAFNQGLSPTLHLTIRFFLATIILSIIFYKEVLKLTKKNFKKVFWLGILVILGYTFQIVGSKYTTASKAGFYTALNIVFVPYIAWILHRKSPSINTYIATLVGMTGIFFISYEKGTNLFQLNIGDMLIIVSAMFFGAQIAITGSIVKRVKPIKVVLIQIYIATIGFILIEIVLIILKIDILRPLTHTEWYALIYLGLINSGLCIFGQVTLQKYVSEVKTSLLLTTESLFAPIFGYFILSEHIGLNVILGSICIFSSLLILELKLVKKDKL